MGGREFCVERKEESQSKSPMSSRELLFEDLKAEGVARHFGHYMEIDRVRRLSFTWYTDEGHVESTSLVCLDLKTTHETRGESVTWLNLEHMMDAEWKDYSRANRVRVAASS